MAAFDVLNKITIFDELYRYDDRKKTHILSLADGINMIPAHKNSIFLLDREYPSFALFKKFQDNSQKYLVSQLFIFNNNTPKRSVFMNLLIYNASILFSKAKGTESGKALKVSAGRNIGYYPFFRLNKEAGNTETARAEPQR